MPKKKTCSGRRRWITLAWSCCSSTRTMGGELLVVVDLHQRQSTELLWVELRQIQRGGGALELDRGAVGFFGVRRELAKTLWASTQGVRLYTNPTAPARERRRQTGRRGIQLGHRHDDNLHSPCDVEDIGGVDPPLHNLAMRTTGRGSERHGGQRQRRRTWLWMDKQLRETLAAVDDGMSMRKAATTFNIPYSSFREWCYGIRNTRKKGPPTALSPEEEDELVKYLIQMCDRGYGLSPTALRMKVYDITQSMWTSFQNGIPGNGWMRWWKRRYPALTLRLSQALESA